MEIKLPNALERVIAHLRRLPGVGNQTAQRHAWELLGWQDEELAAFAGELAALHEKVGFCPVCGFTLDGGAPCQLCSATGRDATQICVVETPAQVPVFEKTGCYHGLYHILGGRFSPLSGVLPENLRISQLRERLSTGKVKELILATSTDVEGQATARLLQDEFQEVEGLAITRLAIGIPSGADLAYTSTASLAQALSGRQNF